LWKKEVHISLRYKTNIDVKLISMLWSGLGQRMCGVLLDFKESHGGRISTSLGSTSVIFMHREFSLASDGRHQ
jgi:hypothetical protein